jgi:phosphoglycolate phosphatase-like HAD superfamily hydrolase
LVKLILFDIDGTLLDAGDLSKQCFLNTVRGRTGADVVWKPYSSAGKTDPQIMRELLLVHGVPRERVEEIMDQALKAYQSCFLSALERATVRPLPGARELIAHLAGLGTAAPLLGLLSGNMQGLVVRKLEAAGIPATSFVVGAFGSDNADRDKLPAIAVERVAQSLGRYLLPQEVAIVGDTPLDIKCARSFGAIPIAVATGEFTCQELAASSPAHVLRSLLDWGEIERELDLER